MKNSTLMVRTLHMWIKSSLRIDKERNNSPIDVLDLTMSRSIDHQVGVAKKMKVQKKEQEPVLTIVVIERAGLVPKNIKKAV